MKPTIEEHIEELAKEHKVQLVLSQEPTLDDEISLADLMKKILDSKKLIVACTLVAFILGSIVFLGYGTLLEDKKGNVSTVVSFNFEGIEEGLDPNGDTFNIGEVTNKSVLEKTISQFGLASKGIDAEMLRENISIQGVVPQEIANQIATINKMAEKDVTQLQKINDMVYYPTQYKLDLKVSKKMHLDGEEAMQVLSGLVENYKDYFMTKYNDKELLSTAITTIDPMSYDYAEYILLVEEHLNIAKAVLEEKALENESFRAKSTGMSFEDLLSQVSLLKDVEINNVQAIINTYMITKDKHKLISLYTNKIQTMELQKEESVQQVVSLKQTIEAYKKDTALLLGGENSQSATEFKKSSETYDNLVSTMLEAEKKVNQLAYDIQYHKELLAKLSPAEEEAVHRDLKPYIAQVEKNISGISIQIVTLVTSVNQTLEEYYTSEVFKNSVKMDVPAMYQSNTMNVLKQGMLIIVIVTLLGMMAGFMLALTKGILIEETKR